jgi:hypothetical protein
MGRNELTAERALAATQATGSLRAEGLAPSAAAQAISERWINGEISTAQMQTMIRELHGVQ